MKMIIGGAYQGQIQWAQEQYKNITWIDGNTCSLDAVFSCQGIVNFHMLIRRMLQTDTGFLANDLSVKDFANKLKRQNPEILIVSNEIGYGLVPVDAFERTYREVTGRICTELASYSDEVTRVVMGVGVVLKH